MSSEDLSCYLDRRSLLEALRCKTGRSDVELLEDGVEVKRATKGVEGFLSLVLRVKVPYRLGDGNNHAAVLIVKCIPQDGSQSEIIKWSGAFPREGTFFHEVFPLLKKASGGKVPLPVPTCYHTKYGGEDDAIYMEDLCASGFRTPAASYRTKGLDIDHCRLAMDAYGRFHALTIAAERLLPEDKPTWSEAFPLLDKDPLTASPVPGESPMPFQGMIDQSIENLLDIAKELDGLPKEAESSGKLRSVLGNFWNLIRKLVKPAKNVQKVLSHGDCWMNNSMFRYEVEGEVSKPVDLKLLDFQIVRCCHPCIDLMYFLYVSVRKPSRMKHMDSLIRLYYDSLERSLRIMKYGQPPFTLEEFLKDIHEVYKGFGLIYEALFMPLLLLGEEFTPPNAEEFTSEKYSEFIKTGNSSSIRHHYATDPNYRSIMDELIRDLVDIIFPNGLNSPISPLFLL